MCHRGSTKPSIKTSGVASGKTAATLQALKKESSQTVLYVYAYPCLETDTHASTPAYDHSGPAWSYRPFAKHPFHSLRDFQRTILRSEADRTLSRLRPERTRRHQTRDFCGFDLAELRTGRRGEPRRRLPGYSTVQYGMYIYIYIHILVTYCTSICNICNICKQINKYIHIHTHVCMYVCIYIYMYVCMYVYIYIYI